MEKHIGGEVHSKVFEMVDPELEMVPEDRAPAPVSSFVNVF